KMYVVANGKYVFDINQWIRSHPGGQLILHSVAGTDITNDYFHEAGYDAAAFVSKKDSKLLQAGPRALPSNLNINTIRSNLNMSTVRTSLSKDNTAAATWVGPIPEEQQQAAAQLANVVSSLTEAEWKRVLRARRPHVHTRLAIQKLSTLLVGEIQHPSGKAAGAYDPSEYRRYALVESQLVTTASTVLNPVYKLKFALLYPYDYRTSSPPLFLPGQCIEIQCRIGGSYVSRYYTPVNGGPSGFEVIMKVYPNGVLTPFLARQKPGERQFKIRGPFGSPFVDPEKPIVPHADVSEWCHDRLLFICGGSGLAPALQLLEYLFLPTYVPLFVHDHYKATHGDEITLEPGNWVIVRTHLMDGWAEGVNLSTNQS
ncbi:hypothetical protein HK102_011516, partial [Quaeritorhiza haematococci]